jgi:hypothetical protein
LKCGGNLDRKDMIECRTNFVRRKITYFTF